MGVVREDNSIPDFTDEQIRWLTRRFCNKVSRDDSNDIIRWKAAQRELIDEVIAVNNAIRDKRV